MGKYGDARAPRTKHSHTFMLYYEIEVGEYKVFMEGGWYSMFINDENRRKKFKENKTQISKEEYLSIMNGSAQEWKLYNKKIKEILK